VSRVLSPVAAAAAAFYFLIDAIFLSAVRTIIRPLARALSRLRIFNALAAWLASLGPYPTLVLFLVPVIILEPVKPVGAYLIATGHLVSGISLIAIGATTKRQPRRGGSRFGRLERSRAAFVIVMAVSAAHPRTHGLFTGA
jgi:hypothetical protein